MVRVQYSFVVIRLGKRLPRFVLVVPRINRQIMDLWFSLVYMMDDFGPRSLLSDWVLNTASRLSTIWKTPLVRRFSGDYRFCSLRRFSAAGANR